MDAKRDFWATPGPMTAPGKHSRLLDGLPTDIAGLCRVVQGLVLHVYWADNYGVKLTPERAAETEVRSVEERLGRIVALDPRGLGEARPAERRTVGTCRDFTLLLVALLRHQGVPARARAGFGRYFQPDWYMDHWIAEVWSPAKRRWVGVDPQMDRLQREALKLPFDPLDVPRDQFLSGGGAWRQWRAGKIDAQKCGIGELKGKEFLSGNLVRDLAALNKTELLPWDDWGAMDGANDALLDAVAESTGGQDVDAETVQKRYRSGAGLRVPQTIVSHTRDGDKTVRLPAALVRDST